MPRNRSNKGKERELNRTEDFGEELKNVSEQGEKSLSEEQRAERNKTFSMTQATTNKILERVSAEGAKEIAGEVSTAVEQSLRASPESRTAFEGARDELSEVDADIESSREADSSAGSDSGNPGRSKEIRMLYATYIIAVMGIVSGLSVLGTFIYALATRAADGRESALNDPEIMRLWNAWNSKPDSEFWAEVSNYVARNPEITMRDEASMLKVILPMCTDTGWIWASAKEYDSAIEQLSSLITGNDTSAAYDAVMTLKFGSLSAPDAPVLLPRRVACEVLSLAIARYLRREPA